MAHERHFLVVDTDARARAALAGLLGERFECQTTETEGAERTRSLMKGGARFDAILVEARLGEADGRDLCRELRAGGFGAPILILGASARESDVVWALDAGASDYIAKPYRPAELLARVRAQLRAHDVSEHAEIPLGPNVFRVGTRTLVPASGGRPTRLTDKEAALLKRLHRASGAAVSRETLLREVWGYRDDASTHTVETHVYRLRRKIEWPDVVGRLLTSEGGNYRLDLAAARAKPWVRQAAATVGMLAMAAAGD